MKLTVSQLRRIIKEEVRRIAEVSPAPIGSAAYYRDEYRKKFKQRGINPVFDGVDWSDPAALSKYSDVDSETKVPGYAKAVAAFKKAGLNMPSPWDRYEGQGDSSQAQLEITGAHGLRRRPGNEGSFEFLRLREVLGR